MENLKKFNELWKKHIEKEKIRILQKTSPEFVEIVRSITFEDLHLQNGDESEIDWVVEVNYKGKQYDFRYVYCAELIDYDNLLNEEDVYVFEELLNEIEATTHIKKLRQEKLEQHAGHMNEKHQHLLIKEVKASDDGDHVIYVLSNGETVYVKHDV